MKTLIEKKFGKVRPIEPLLIKAFILPNAPMKNNGAGMTLSDEEEIEKLENEIRKLRWTIGNLDRELREGKISEDDYDLLRERYERKLEEIEQKLGMTQAEVMREKRRRPRERRPKKREIKISLPWATIVLVLLNIVIFVILRESGWLNQALYDYGMTPAAVLRGEGLHGLLTSMFMHVNEWHLIGNMIFLLVFGTILERRIGTPKFLVIYLLAHFAASLFNIAVRPGSWIPVVGASAAIMGVMGACFLGYPWSRAPLGFMIWITWPLISLFLPCLIAFFAFFAIVLPVMLLTLTKFVSIWPFVMAAIIYQLIMGIWVAQGAILVGVAYWAHITGFVAGMLLIFFLKPGEEK